MTITNMLAFGMLLSSVFTITSKNPVISIIFLISTFVHGALYLILIGMKFVGIAYIVIYVGAIAVLFLFIIMLLNIKLNEITEVNTQYTKNLPLAIAIGSLFIFILFQVIKNTPPLSVLLDTLTVLNGIVLYNEVLPLSSINSLVNHYLFDILLTEFTQIEVLGYSLYLYGAVLLIILSVILLLAMFATIIISKKNPGKNKNPGNNNKSF
jgi:NADH-ubiquinone oxidoreductase chain 6